jgi:hypothetical protein
MITDDPGTPGDRHWEINLAWTEQETPGSRLSGLPLLDANYGVGDRIQLNYQASWNRLGTDGGERSGMSASQLAVKWRFYDSGPSGLQVSTYPRYTFLDPGSDSDRRGAAGSSATLLVPVEVAKDLGFLTVDVDFGLVFSSAEVDRGWMGGVCLGREIAKGWELDAEVHLNGSEHLRRNEAIVNLGTRYDFSAHATLLLAIGKDTSDSLGPRTSLLTFVGFQVRL